jgi:hypothetical protein
MFFSGLLTTDGRVLYQESLDEHLDLVKYFKVSDVCSPELKTFEPFVIFPKDGDVFNKERDNWVFSIVNEFAYAKLSSVVLKSMVDVKRILNDDMPKWITDGMVADCFKAFQSVLNRRVVTSGNLGLIDDGRWFIGGTTNVTSIGGKAVVELLAGKATVWHIEHAAQVKKIEGDVTVWSMRGNCSIGTIKDNVRVLTIGDKTRVWEIKGGSVDNIGDCAEIGCIRGCSTKIRSIGDKAKVKAISEGCNVDYVGGVSRIDELLNYAVIHTLRNKAVVGKAGHTSGIEFIEQQSTVEEAYPGARIGLVKDRAVVHYLGACKSVWQVGESKVKLS